MNRRTVLANLGTVAVALAGCTSASSDPGTKTPTPDLPAECPTTQNLDLKWPNDLDAAAVEEFVETYEAAYYRQKVVEYDPESRLASYELDGTVSEGPTEQDDGWLATYSGSGGIYRPTLAINATAAEPPGDADVVPASEFDDELISKILEDAIEHGEADTVIEPPGEKVDAYLDRFASTSDDFEGLSSRGESDTLYVDVDGKTVKLHVAATDLHGDYWWDASYYVDEYVIWRTSDLETDPKNGTLLECREP